jgi:hypothetical protein
MSTLVGIFKAIQRREASIRQIIQRREAEIRRIIGGHLPHGRPMVHVRCGTCGKRVASVEESDGNVFTFWRGRRFPGVPRLLDCPEHGNLRIDESALRAKALDARRTGKAQTLKL